MITEIVLAINLIIPFCETYVFPFVILLGLLVFFHELGHFIISKLVKVKVEEFSLGFPPKLIGKKIGETEYRISLLPLGGYVKLAGQDDFKGATVNNKPYEYYSKSPFQRLLILFSGPTFNFIIGTLLFFIIFIHGKEVSYNPASPGKIGNVLENSPAEKAGLQYGDEIIKMGTRKIQSWNNLIELSINPQSNRYKLLIKRDNKLITREITPEKIGIRYMMGIVQYQEPIIGKVIYDIDTFNQDIENKLISGDKILKVNNYSIRQWRDFIEFIKFNPEHEIELTVLRKGKTKKLKIKPSSDIIKQIGYIQAPFKIIERNNRIFYSNIIDKVRPGTDIYKAGMRENDKILKVNDIKITSKAEFIDAVSSFAEKEIELTLSRNEKIKKIKLIPAKKDLKLGSLPVYPLTYIEKYTLFNSIKHSLNQTYNICAQTIQVLFKVISRKMEAKNVFGGPITIWKITVIAAQSSVLDFLSLMGVISVSLGLINLFPIPGLDGGHIVISLFEIVRGRMPSEKTLNIVHQIGLAILIMLMIYIFYIDILRLN